MTDKDREGIFEARAFVKNIVANLFPNDIMVFSPKALDMASKMVLDRDARIRAEAADERLMALGQEYERRIEEMRVKIAEATEKAAREERERFSEAVRIIATAWTADHKDWREFDAGYTSALEQVSGMIQKDLAPDTANEKGEQ